MYLSNDEEDVAAQIENRIVGIATSALYREHGETQADAGRDGLHGGDLAVDGGRHAPAHQNDGLVRLLGLADLGDGVGHHLMVDCLITRSNYLSLFLRMPRHDDIFLKGQDFPNAK